MRKHINRNTIGAVVLTAALLILITALYFYKNVSDQPMSYVDFIDNMEQGLVSSVILGDGSKLRFQLADSDQYYITDNPRIAGLKEQLLLHGAEVSEGGDVTAMSLLQSFLSIAISIGAFYFAYRILGRQNVKSAMALNAEDVNDTAGSRLSFQDIAGNDEAKESVQDIVDFIKNPDKYFHYGARMPRGVIFYGPPGTGKTLMAKAIAGEAGVPFFAVSGSDFVQMYVGVGAGRVRELFKKAREKNKAVIFIDEIDALGKKRSATVTGGNDERDQTLNALLTEMSGFSGGEGIIVIAATNRLDTLDEALLRPGRFDRQVEIGLPDFNARHRILTHHAKNKPLSDSINMDRLARQTVYFSGAMLENLLNESAIYAAKRNADAIGQEDIDKAYYTVIAGSEKKDRSAIKERDREITAYHESGHALVAKLATPENTVSKITIIPSTKGAGGFCVNIPPDKMYYTKKELESQIMVSFAGRAAEELIFGEDNITTGAGNDIEKATGIIKDYVTKYGMGSRMGMLNIDAFNADKAADECADIMNRLYESTKKLIAGHIRTLRAIASELLSRETLHEEELDQILQNT